jgi:hypothetical protein
MDEPTLKRQISTQALNFDPIVDDLLSLLRNLRNWTLFFIASNFHQKTADDNYIRCKYVVMVLPLELANKTRAGNCSAV